jgi:hypothetical protein
MPTINVPTSKLLLPLDGFSTANFGGASGAITSSNGGVAVYYVPQVTHNVTTIVFQYTINTAPSPNTFDVGIQGVNATTGFPDGTFITSGTWTAPASGSGFATTTVTTTSLTKGTAYYLVIRNAVSGFTGSVNIFNNVNNTTTGKTRGAHGRISGVWSAATVRPGGGIWLYDGTKYYGTGLQSSSGSEAAVTGVNEIGTTLTLPVNTPDISLYGVCIYAVTINAGSLYDIILKNSAGTTLSTITLDGDHNQNYIYGIFPSAQTITAGSKYYIMMKANTGTTPLIRTAVNFSGALMTDIRNGVVMNKVTYNGTTYTETTGSTLQGYLLFNNIAYTQTGGASVYSIPASFSQLEG